MNKYYEYLSGNGVWKQLFVITWEEAIERSKEYGYAVREVLEVVVSKAYYPGMKHPDE